MLECRALSPSPSKEIKVEPECIPRQEELFLFGEDPNGTLMYKEIDVADLEPFQSEMVRHYVNFFHQSNRYYGLQETHVIDTHFLDTAQTLRSIPPLEQILAANATYLHQFRDDLAELVMDPLSLFLPDPPHGFNLSNIEVTLADRSNFFF